MVVAAGAACADDALDPNSEPVATVVVEPTNATVAVGASVPFTALVTDAAGNTLAGRRVHWISENPDIASVSSAGVATGRHVGGVRIAANVEGVSAIADLNVAAPAPPPIGSVSISPSSAPVNVAWTITLSATVRDVNNAVVNGAEVTWSSTNTAVAVVSSSGVVTGVSPGTATIRASAGGKTATASVTVQIAPVDRLEIAPSDVTIEEKESVRLSATLYDARGNVLTGHKVTWESSDTRVATVDSNGRVRGEREGTVTITATASGKAGTARVRVEDD